MLGCYSKYFIVHPNKIIEPYSSFFCGHSRNMNLVERSLWIEARARSRRAKPGILRAEWYPVETRSSSLPNHYHRLSFDHSTRSLLMISVAQLFLGLSALSLTSPALAKHHHRSRLPIQPRATNTGDVIIQMFEWNWKRDTSTLRWTEHPKNPRMHVPKFWCTHTERKNNQHMCTKQNNPTTLFRVLKWWS